MTRVTYAGCILPAGRHPNAGVGFKLSPLLVGIALSHPRNILVRVLPGVIEDITVPIMAHALIVEDKMVESRPVRCRQRAVLIDPPVVRPNNGRVRIDEPFTACSALPTNAAIGHGSAINDGVDACRVKDPLIGLDVSAKNAVLDNTGPILERNAARFEVKGTLRA